MSYGVELIDATPNWLDVPFLATYLIYGDRYVLVDAGVKSSADKLIIALSNRDFDELDYIVTHIHIDHVGGLGYLHERFKGYVYLHPKALKHVADPSRLWESAKEALGSFAELYGEPKPVEEKYLIPVDDGMTIHSGGELMFIHTPGHASHHISIYHYDSKGLFVGDSAGIYIAQLEYIIPTTLYPCKLDLYMASLKKMASLKPDIIYYAHYGISEEGWRKMDELYKRIVEWGKIAADSDSIESFTENILSEDESFRYIYNKLDEIPLAKILVDLAIKGIYEEVKRNQNILSQI